MTTRARGHAGVSLIEVIVAVGVLAVLAGAVLPVTAVVARAEHDTRVRAIASAAAVSQLERLRALAFHVLPDGSVAVDTVSRAAEAGYLADGGGLGDAPAGVLDADIPGYADAPGPEDAAAGPPTPLVRRWEVRTHPGEPHCRVLRVEVARRQVLIAGVPMARAAIARTDTVVCVAGERRP